MRGFSRAFIPALLIVCSSPLSAQTQRPDLTGTWKLDAERSRISADVSFAGLIAAGAPPRLHITHPTNGTLIVESEVNEGHVRVYSPRAKTSTPVFIGPAGTVSMTSKWQDPRTLVGEGTYESTSGPSSSVRQIKDLIALGADGTLTIELSAAGATDKTTLVYTRTSEVGPCETWSTPCKRK